MILFFGESLGRRLNGALAILDARILEVQGRTVCRPRGTVAVEPLDDAGLEIRGAFVGADHGFIATEEERALQVVAGCLRRLERRLEKGHLVFAAVELAVELREGENRLRAIDNLRLLEKLLEQFGRLLHFLLLGVGNVSPETEHALGYRVVEATFFAKVGLDAFQPFLGPPQFDKGDHPVKFTRFRKPPASANRSDRKGGG